MNTYKVKWVTIVHAENREQAAREAMGGAAHRWGEGKPVELLVDEWGGEESRVTVSSETPFVAVFRLPNGGVQVRQEYAVGEGPLRAKLSREGNLISLVRGELA